MGLPSPFSARPPRARRRARPALVVAAAAVAALGAGAPAASAATSCATQHLTVQALQSNVFYVDAATNYLGSYVGYRVTNTDTAARRGLWERLESFQGGVVSPAAGGAATAAIPVDDLSAGAAAPTYSYLKASGATSTAQSFDVVLYAGRPGAGGVELCRAPQTLTSVQDVIKAAANQVSSAVLAPASATLGGEFQLTVKGSTGTVGAGIASDPGIVRFSPAVAAAWPSSAFRLVGVSSRLPDTAPATPDVLSLGGMSGPNRAYTITYRFRVVGPTDSSTEVVPVQNIASGTQVKHTDPSGLGALPPIPKVTSSATVSASAGGTAPYVSGATVPLSATVTNTATTPVAVDEMVLRLPGAWTAVPGTAKAGGAAVADPFDAGAGELHLVGPFTVPASGTLTFTLDAKAGAPGSSGAFTAAGTLAGGQLDASLDPSDNVPASTTLTVLGAPVAAADALSAATDATTALDVLANDDTANGTPVLSLLSTPENGSVSVAGGHIAYTPQEGFSGQDSFVYRVTTAGGSSTATVTVTVAAPPAAPAPQDVGSTGVGVEPQQGTLAFPAGGSVRLLDGHTPVTALTVPGQGSYALDAETGAVTFTPVLGFAGKATPLPFRVTDSFGQSGEAFYTPEVTAPPSPAPDTRTSTGVGPASQTTVLPIPPGGRVRLLDAGTPAAAVASVTVDGEGLYSLDTTSGQVTFAPAIGFRGTGAGVTFRVTDAYDHSGSATYTPTVTLPPVPAPADVTSTGVGTAPQQHDLLVPDGATLTLLDADGRPADSVTVPGEGTYALDGETVGFTPVLGFRGAGTGVRYRITDAYRQSGVATYAPTVTRPVLPAPADVDSTGEGVAPQARTLPIPPGGSVRLLDLDGTPRTSVTIPGEGTYDLDARTGVVTFTPVLGFAAPATPLSYQVTDAYGQTADALLRAVVTAPPTPEPPAATSTGTQTAPQTQSVPVPPSGSVTLLDAGGHPADRVRVAGVGEYVLDAASGRITFTPEAGYVGTPDGVRYRVIDAYGQSREATYTPTVVAIALTAPAAPGTPSPAAPARSCASRRTMTVHWRVAHGLKVSRQVLMVNGRTARRLTRTARRATVDLRGLAAGTVTVIVRASIGGHTFTTTRVYHPCRGRMPAPPLKTLALAGRAGGGR